MVSRLPIEPLGRPVCELITLYMTALSFKSLYATHIGPPKAGSVLLLTKTPDQTRLWGDILSTCTVRVPRTYFHVSFSILYTFWVDIY